MGELVRDFGRMFEMNIRMCAESNHVGCYIIYLCKQQCSDYYDSDPKKCESHGSGCLPLAAVRFWFVRNPGSKSEISLSLSMPSRPCTPPFLHFSSLQPQEATGAVRVCHHGVLSPAF